MGIKETLGSLEIRLLGNRLFALGMTLVTGGFSASFIYGLNSDTRNFFLSYAVGTVGAGLVGINVCGKFTLETYQRTKKHIKQYGEIRPQFFQEDIKETNGHICGYCHTQGMYLAAREYGQLESFRSNKRKYSKCLIPNF